VARCLYFFILAVPKKFRYPVWGQEPHSLTHRHRRLLTQKRTFIPAYYFTVGTSGKAVKECYVTSAGLLVDYLQSSVFISTYETQMKLEPPSAVCQRGMSTSEYVLGISRPHSAASNCLYLFGWANSCTLFILFFKASFCNGPETELKCNTGIREQIPLVFYHIQTVGA